MSYEPALGSIDFTNIEYRDEDVDCVWNALTGQHEVLNTTSVDCVTTADDGNPRLDWIVVGGESGPGARPFDVAWARRTVRQCAAAGVPVFVKQLGAVPCEGEEYPRDYPIFLWPSAPIRRVAGDVVYRSLKDRKGGDPAEWPEDLRIRELPEVPA